MDVAQANLDLNNTKTVALFCRCTVRYSGRAEAFLDEGDRLIVIKADKTLLIHQPRGSAPVNYMKEGAAHKLVEADGKVHLHASHIAQKEFLDIDIKQVYHYAAHELDDAEKIQLVGSERDMSDMIYNAPELIDDDFRPLSREEHTKYGFIDVFGYDRNNTLVVIECKRYVGDLKAVDQLERYVKKIKELRGLQKVRGILACPKISPNALAMLNDRGYEYRAVSPPNYFERYDKQQKKLGEY